MFDGLGGEGLWGAAGGGGSLSPQRLMAHTLGSPAGHEAGHRSILLTTTDTEKSSLYRKQIMYNKSISLPKTYNKL